MSNGRVVAFTAVLVAIAAALCFHLRESAGQPWPMLGFLAALVAAAEFLQVRFRLGTHLDGNNLVEAALAPLLVVSPDLRGVLAVAAGQLVAATARRNSPVKGMFNIAQWSVATAVGALVWTSADEATPTTARGAVALVLAVAVVGLVNLAAFSTLMLLLGHDLRALRPIIGIGWCAGLAVNVLLGLLFAIAYEGAAAGLLLVPVLFVVLRFTYDGYASARADRARLVGMHRAVSVLTEPLDPLTALESFLRTTSEVFEAATAVLVMKVEAGREIRRVTAGVEGIELRFEDEDDASFEGAMTAQLGAIRVVSSHSGPLAAALRDLGHLDCLAVPILDGRRVLVALLLLDQAGFVGDEEGQLRVLEALAREAASAFGKGRLLESVLEERRKLAIVVGATSDGIAAVGEDGIVRSWNPALTLITGLSEQAVVGRADALDRLDARAGNGTAVDIKAWASAGSLPNELSVVGLDGGRRRLACSYSHAEDEDGRTLVVVARDITPVQEFEALRAEFGRLVEQEAARRLVVEQLQAAVVPKQLEVEGLELAVAYVASDPQEPTGGDLWDWHVMRDGEVHLAVVDVLGHGVAATKSALSVVHILRALALDATPLELMVERASSLLERADDELVATVVLARLDPRTGRLRVASGGHPPALVLSAGGAVRQITATGGAIGWPGAGSDGVEELVLEPGDALLLYTDGLVEARKDIVEGLDSLARETASVAHLPVAELADELVSRALEGAERRDDTLALVVRRTATLAASIPEQGAPDSLAERWTIRPERHAAQRLRRDAARWLEDRDIPAGDAALVIAELLSNAVRAARSRVSLELLVLGGRVQITVTDDGAGLDELPLDVLPDLEAEGSRGLFLVRRLSHDLTVEGTSTGTRVACWLPVLPVGVATPAG